MLYIIYADIDYFKKNNNCKNNPEKSSTKKIGKQISCGYSISTNWAFDHIENKHSLHQAKDQMKRFCKSLKEHAANITDFEKKKKCFC